MTRAPKYMRVYHYREKFEELEAGNVVRISFGKERSRDIVFKVVRAQGNSLVLERGP